MVEVPETAGCLEMSQGRQQLQSWTATFPFVLSKPLELAAAACSLLLADKSGRQQYEQKACTMYLVIASGQQLQESVGSFNTLYDNRACRCIKHNSELTACGFAHCNGRQQMRDHLMG